MNIKKYQELAPNTLNNDLNYTMQLLNCVCGLAGESREVADIIKKHMFQNHILDVDHIEEEIRDVMFYICNLATLLELNMETILEKNIKKLAKRYPKGFESEKSINRFVFHFRHRL